MDNKEKQHTLLLTLAALIATLVVVAAVVTAWHQSDDPADQPKHQISAVKHHADTVRDTMRRALKPQLLKPIPKPSTMIQGTLRRTDGTPVAAVTVSDGIECVKTDSLGHYALRRQAAAHFVYYTVPDWAEVPTHSHKDHTACIYQRITPTDSVYDFRLKPLPTGKENRYAMLVFGDPQVTNAYSPYYTGPNDNPVKITDVARFSKETMTDVRQTLKALPADMPVYGLSMGDDVQYYGGFNATLETKIRKTLGSSRMRLFSVIGNHDQDGKDLYKRKWEEAWGPTDYSFDRGDEHYVCFNDCHFYRGSIYWQPGELTDRQMAWLKQDLALADKQKKVVLCYHIPLTMGTRPKKGAEPVGIATEEGHFTSSRLTEILALLDTFKGGYELFCGHTHFALNHELDYHGRHLLEHCHAAACGNIWQSNVNICGTPNGYYVYGFQGTAIYTDYYKGTRWNRMTQMALFRADTDFNGESYAADWSLPRGKGVIVANVFNADSRWKVYAIENGVEHPMKRLSGEGQDAFAVGYHHRYAVSVPYQFVGKHNKYLIMNHLYYYEPLSPSAEITVRAHDPYGNVYRASSRNVITEPFFNYAHYYPNNSRK